MPILTFCYIFFCFSNTFTTEKEQDKLYFVSFNWDEYDLDSLSDKIQVKGNTFAKSDSFVKMDIFVLLDTISSFAQSDSWEITLYNHTNDTLHFVRRRNHGGPIITFRVNPKIVLPNEKFIIDGGILRRSLRGKFHKRPGIQFVSSKRTYQIHTHLKGYVPNIND